jgi:UDP-N-acetylglucosamine transferase subunit ALG13
MIFLTVGVQLPFDRLVRAVDTWAGETGETDVVAQTGASTYECQHIKAKPYLALAEFQDHVQRAELVVAHAGMGSIITALEMGKSIIVMPRRAALMEHRNDHQLSTARHMAEHGLITVANDEHELAALLRDRTELKATQQISSEANADLINGLKAFIQKDTQPSIVSRLLRPYASAFQRIVR